MTVTIAVRTKEYYDQRHDDFVYDEKYVDVDVDTDMLAEIFADEYGITEDQASNIIVEYNLHEQLIERYADELEMIAYDKYKEEWD